MDIIVATTLVTGQELDNTFNAIAKVTKRLLQLDWIVKIRHVYKKGNKKTIYFWILGVADLCVVENMEKSMSKAELSKEMCTSPTVQPNDCGNGKAPINYQ
ncbi:hypothetical protein Gohar_025095 [Gossypium harknessii]|uniref:Uncharacterized protein n=1 Tax=Gossypium harknessii TaxID=34285 RepID=A0A7J9HJ41_9ROSI|nr:hypothetical protein [Gossypium harknessii]